MHKKSRVEDQPSNVLIPDHGEVSSCTVSTAHSNQLHDASLYNSFAQGRKGVDIPLHDPKEQMRIAGFLDGIAKGASLHERTTCPSQSNVFSSSTSLSEIDDHSSSTSEIPMHRSEMTLGPRSEPIKPSKDLIPALHLSNTGTVSGDTRRVSEASFSFFSNKVSGNKRKTSEGSIYAGNFFTNMDAEASIGGKEISNMTGPKKGSTLCGETLGRFICPPTPTAHEVLHQAFNGGALSLEMLHISSGDESSKEVQEDLPNTHGFGP